MILVSNKIYLDLYSLNKMFVELFFECEMKSLNIYVLLTIFSFLSLFADEESAGLRESFFFDGVDDLIVVPNDSLLNSPSMTITLDFKVLDSASLKSGKNKTGQFLLFKKNPMEHFNEGIAIFYDEVAKNITGVVSNLERKQVYAYSKRGSIEKGKWYSIVVSANDEILRLFLDGVEQKSNPTGFSLMFDKEPLLIGGRNNVILEYTKFGGMFDGEIKNIRMYNKSLSEIGEEYFFSKDSSLDSMLILDFSYHESDGIIHDKYGNNNGVMLRGRPSNKEIKQPEYVKVRPNPIESKGEISFNLQNLTDLKLIIRDLSGQEVMLLHSGPLKAGEHKFELSAENIKAGYYVCYLEAGSSIRTASFIVVK